MTPVGIFDRFRRRQPRGEPLTELVARATRERCRRPREQDILYETTDRREISAIAAALDTTASMGGICMCIGTLVFELEAIQPGAITLHHGVSLRWEGSGGNLHLRSPDAVMDWLSSHGIRFVREEYEDDRRRADETSAQARRWCAAMPASLLPFFDEMRQSGADRRPEWTAAIETEVPDPVERARVLLDLLGSGVGPWTGYPSWESVPERLLLDLPLTVLLAAIGDAPDERRREGAARLFSSWWFDRKRRDDRAMIPQDLRRRLLAHVEASADEDKQQRARAALSP
jgi:hypothetical protein